MSEDFQEPAADEVPAAKPARKRPAVRKSAKAKPPEEAEATAAPAAAAPAVETPAPAVAAPSAVPTEDAKPPREPAPADDAPQPIPFVVETAGGELPGNPKKRRRRKKKGGQAGAPHPHPHAVAPPADAPPLPPENAHAPVMHAAPRPKLDPELVAKKAWKIFQAEVGEEGLALIDDHDAREISRRCFRLAEIFLEEAARRNR